MFWVRNPRKRIPLVPHHDYSIQKTFDFVNIIKQKIEPKHHNIESGVEGVGSESDEIATYSYLLHNKHILTSHTNDKEFELLSEHRHFIAR